LKKDKKLLENKLCEEVLSDLMILQRYLFTATLSTLYNYNILYIVFAVLHNFYPATSTQLFSSWDILFVKKLYRELDVLSTEYICRGTSAQVAESSITGVAKSSTPNILCGSKHWYYLCPRQQFRHSVLCTCVLSTAQ
jgi:hypothetical protein